MKNVITIISILFISNLTYGQNDLEYGKTLQKMFEVSGSEETFNVVIGQMFSMFKDQYTEVEQDLWGELEKEFTDTSMDDLAEMLIPVYQKYMTLDDLKELIKFYESPVGKKFAKNTPMITQESMQIGQQWGMKIGENFARKMEERGY